MFWENPICDENQSVRLLTIVTVAEWLLYAEVSGALLAAICLNYTRQVSSHKTFSFLLIVCATLQRRK